MAHDQLRLQPFEQSESCTNGEVEIVGFVGFAVSPGLVTFEWYFVGEGIDCPFPAWYEASDILGGFDVVPDAVGVLCQCDEIGWRYFDVDFHLDTYLM